MVGKANKGTPENFVFLDANILIRVVSQSRPGCEREHWDALKAMVDKGDVTLLLPKIVVMELDKQIFHSKEDFYVTVEKTKDHIKKLPAEVWNEARQDLVDYLDKALEKWQASRITKWAQNGAAIRKWLWTPSKNIKQLRFDAEIWFRGKVRLIEGRLPKAKQKKRLQADEEGKSKAREWARDNDCAIVESLIDFFGKKTKDRQLFFCTENLDDFGFEKPATKRLVLDKRLQPDLPPTEIFLDLASLVKALGTRKPIETPPTDEEFEQVLKEKVEEEERIAREMSWESVTETGLPTPQHICGQNLQRIHDIYAPQWKQAVDSNNVFVAHSVMKMLAPLIVDFVHQYYTKIPKDSRAKQLAELRDKLREYAEQMPMLQTDEMWGRGSLLLLDLINLARAFQLT